MLRMLLMLCVVVGISGSILYSTKRSVDNRFDELRQLEQEISDAEERAMILSAEWAYLSRPDRMLNLSSQLLSMRPITPDRVLPLDAIPLRQPDSPAQQDNQNAQ